MVRHTCLTCKRFDFKNLVCKRFPYVKVDSIKEKGYLHFGSCLYWLKHLELYNKARDEELKTGNINQFFLDWDKTIKNLKFKGESNGKKL